MITNQRMLFPEPATIIRSDQHLGGYEKRGAHVSHGATTTMLLTYASIPQINFPERTRLPCLNVECRTRYFD